MGNLPRHGDNIIEEISSPLGGKKFVASFQFQRFLDEIGSLSDASDEVQSIASLLSVASKNKAFISTLSLEMQDFLQELASLKAESAKLSALIKQQSGAFNDLEQLVSVV